MDPYKILLIGCSFKSSTILYVCQLPTLDIIHSIELPDQVCFYFVFTLNYI